MNQIISIIIPIFNAGKYIKECVNSITVQSYSNYEIILVNDGSTDNSNLICDELSKYNDKIKVFHKENGGVCSARNFGITVAEGDLICFIDADDTLEHDYLMNLINNIDSKTDLIVMGYKDSNNVEYKIPQKKEWSKDCICSALYELEFSKTLGLVWNKLYRRHIIVDNNIFFDEDIAISEDILFVVRYSLCCNIIKSIPNMDYNYIYRSGSACTKEYDFTTWNKRLDILYNIFYSIRDNNHKLIDRLLFAEYILSLRVLKIAYNDNIEKSSRITYMNKLKARKKNNSQFEFSRLSMINIGILTLLNLNPHITDFILSRLYKCRNFIKTN